MTAFPSLIPSSRIFTPGVYPHTPYQAMSGIEGRVRHSNVMLTSTLRLTFISLTEANMLSILSHYNSKQGGFIAFTIPSQLLNGVSAAADYTLTGYLWRYVQPPIIDDIPCAGHSVELTLESVPPEAVVVSGLASTVLITLTPGDAAAANGIQQQVTITLSGGQAGGSGADFTITSSIAGGVVTVVDPNFASVSLLLHMDGTNSSTTFTDNSSGALSITANGNAQISTAQSKYGGASGLFDGTGDFLSVPSIAIGSSTDCTFECWFYRIGGQALIGDPGAVGNQQLLTVLNGKLYAFWNGNEVEGGTVTDNTWHHAAITRSSGTIRLFFNGTLVASSAGNTTAFSVTRIGMCINRTDWNGYIDDLRITVGVARYTASFTVPSEAYPDA